MKYKVIKGTPLFDSLMALFEEIKISDIAMNKLADEVGADGVSQSSHKFYGDINAFHFKGYQPPDENWSPLNGRHTPWWMPKRPTQKLPNRNKDLWDKINSAPKVEQEKPREILSYNWQAYGGGGGLSVFNRPGIEWYENHILISFPDEIDYTPVEGMVEVLASEYKLLQKSEALTFSNFRDAR